MKIPDNLKTYLTQLPHNTAMDVWRYLEADRYSIDEMIDVIADSHGMKNKCSPDDSRTIQQSFDDDAKMSS